MRIPAEPTENWCEVVVKNSEVAQLIEQRLNWRQGEKLTTRFKVEAFFKTATNLHKTTAELEKIFPVCEFVSDWNP